jgi:hypothetical protein
MSGLETAFYIIGIVFMSLMLILMLVTVIAVAVIRAKVVALHKHIEDKFALVHDIAEKGAAVADTVRKISRQKNK